jgi:hypothetical protein
LFAAEICNRSYKGRAAQYQNAHRLSFIIFPTASKSCCKSHNTSYNVRYFGLPVSDIRFTLVTCAFKAKKAGFNYENCLMAPREDLPCHLRGSFGPPFLAPFPTKSGTNTSCLNLLRIFRPYCALDIEGPRVQSQLASTPAQTRGRFSSLFHPSPRPEGPTYAGTVPCSALSSRGFPGLPSSTGPTGNSMVEGSAY